MEITEDLNPDEMMVYQMTPPSILSVENAAARSSSAGGGAEGGAAAAGGGAGGGLGSAELGRRLLLAARQGDTQLVLDLMAKGAPFTTDWLGTSALHLAALGAHADTCGVLLRAGVSRDARTKVERTPLHLAAYAGHAAVAALLLQHRARADTRDMLAMTPLHWAAARGHAEVAALLLRHGADPLLVSKFRKTPRALAAARGHRRLLRLIDDALAEREAAAATSADKLTTDNNETETGDPQPANDPIERLQEAAKQTIQQSQTQSEPIKINIERPFLESADSESAGAAAAAAMLRRHGIALLPRDEGSTVLSALQSGRSVVLSDAGKLMLKESSDIPHMVVKSSPPPIAPPAPPPAPASTHSKGVVLTATPVKSTPRQGVKIFTLNNKLLAMPKENKAPVKKIINPHDSVQIQYIKLPSDAKITSRSISLRAKHRPSPRAPAAAAAPSQTVRLGGPLHKGTYNKLPADDNVEIVGSPGPEAAAAAAAAAAARGSRSVLFVPEEFLSNSSPKYLRAQLLAAHRTIAALNAQLAECRARLRHYEPLQ